MANAYRVSYESSLVTQNRQIIEGILMVEIGPNCVGH